ncbi:polysaccharide biosynthesis tyrosine autokinase [Microvirga sesbaniae]|uniref:polysaccharide biosynthesis tyrosine autokinase n=1 Tax=Microvirga sesbaniae TaxID=681392 RepID=UPI0021C649C8|nr:tyrosine-protein kinase domain-containing protein [Microvirga sp. HBU67692]
MKSNLGVDRAFIRRPDIGPEVGSTVGNLSLARTNSRGLNSHSDEAADGPRLVAELMSLLRMMRRQLRLIVAITVFVTVASLIVIMSLKKEYTATTLVMLDERNARLLEPSVANTLAADGEVEILKSDNIALQVVDRLGLYRDPDFLPKQGWLGQRIAELTEAVTGPPKVGSAATAISDEQARSTGAPDSAQVDAASDAEADVVDPPAAQALRVFKSKVTVRRRGLTDVIAIDVTDPDPKRAAQYSNAYAEVYLEEQVATKLRGIDRAEAALTRRLSEIDEELKRSETHIGLRQVYQDSLARLKAVAQQRDTVGPDARIASQARPPDLPSFPNRKLFLLLAVLGGFGVSVGIAYLRDLHSRRVHTEDEVEVFTGVPILASLPKLPSSKHHHPSSIADVVVDQPGSRYSESVRTLLFTLQAIMNRGRKIGIVLVTSAEENEGKSTLAVSLARSAAIAGSKVVIVDCNLRDPEVHGLLSIQNEVGLVDLLTRAAPEHAVLQNDPRSHCRAITSGHVASVSPEWLLRTEQIEGVLQSLRAEYDVVILDAPPVERYADSLLFTNVADLVLFAVRSGVAKPQVVKSALTQLQRCSDVDVFPILTAHTT